MKKKYIFSYLFVILSCRIHLFAQSDSSSYLIISESKIYKNLDLDYCEIILQCKDAEINEWIVTDMHFLDNDKNISHTNTDGKVTLRLSLLEKHQISISHPRFNDTVVLIDLSTIKKYQLAQTVLLKPRKTQLDIFLKDIDSGEPVSLGGNLNNLNRNEQIYLNPQNNSNGKYSVNLRTEDEYELEVKHPNKHIFYSNNRINPKTSITKEIEVKIAQALTINSKIALNNISFAYNSSSLNSIAKQELDRVAIFLSDYPTARIEIGAHTDSYGRDNENFNLSLFRAESVLQYLLGKGLSKNQFIIKGYGANQPIASNHTEEGRAKNRRFELKVLRLE